MAKPLAHRLLFLPLGVLFVSLGIIGHFVPVMPSTIFYILALWAFKKSSPRMERWLLDRPIIGPLLRDWEANKAIRPRTKVLAISMVWLAIAGTVTYLIQAQRPAWTSAILLLVAVLLSWYIASRPNAA